MMIRTAQYNNIPARCIPALERRPGTGASPQEIEGYYSKLKYIVWLAGFRVSGENREDITKTEEWRWCETHHPKAIEAAREYMDSKCFQCGEQCSATAEDASWKHLCRDCYRDLNPAKPRGYHRH